MRRPDWPVIPVAAATKSMPVSVKMERMRQGLIAYVLAVCFSAVVPSAAVLAETVNFEVALTSGLNSQTAKVGQKVNARLVSDLRAGSKVLAPAGSSVVGHINKVYTSRRLIGAEVSRKRWLRAGGGIDLQFDSIQPLHGKAIKINARPVGIAETGHQKQSDAPVTVSKEGTVEASRKQDLKPKLARTALGVGAFVAGPITALAGAAVGAVRPKTVLPQSSDGEQPQKPSRLKGAATGFVAGLPGGFLVNDSVLKGQKAVIPSGEHLQLEWNR